MARPTNCVLKRPTFQAGLSSFAILLKQISYLSSDQNSQSLTAQSSNHSHQAHVICPVLASLRPQSLTLSTSSYTFWPPWAFSESLPQGLCTCSSLFLEWSFPTFSPDLRQVKYQHWTFYLEEYSPSSSFIPYLACVFLTITWPTIYF
jgi:hypothetical protein